MVLSRVMSEGLSLRNRVRDLRSRLGLRQADLAREVDVTRQTIIAIEKGKLNPSILICLKISRILREPVDYVFYLDRVSESRSKREVRQPEPESNYAVVTAVPAEPAPPQTGDEPDVDESVAAEGREGDNGHAAPWETAAEVDISTSPINSSTAIEADESPYSDAADEPSFSDDIPEDAHVSDPAAKDDSGGQVMWNF
ncbi:MAG: hypothetical protein AMXMBFR84_49890 [Candidatus Hydrogenedentota bacterium]